MALLPIRTYPDPVLAQKCRPIDQVDQDIRRLAEEMAETMYDAPGVGLAAPQVGRPIRLIVVDTAEGEQRGNPMMLVNPEILEAEGELVFNEGCLSVPDYTADVHRAARVKVQARDLDGKPVHIEAEGLLSVCLQHEIDHLDGRLFIDRISQLKRSMYRKRRLKQLRREGS